MEAQGAMVKGSTWGTAASCGALSSFLFLDEGLRKRQATEIDQSVGVPFPIWAEKSNIAVDGDLRAYLRYEGLMLQLALAMGTAGAPTQQGATAAYKHVLQLNDKLDGLFGTLAFDKIQQFHEYPSVKLAGFSIRGEGGKPCEITFNAIADNQVVPATTNTSKATWTFRDRANRVLFDQATFRVNDQSGAALAPGDVVKPSAFELTYRRKLAGNYLAGNAGKIDEPVNDGFPEVTLRLTFPNYTSNAWWAAFAGDTRKKADITFTGQLIESSYYYTMLFQFPHLILESTEATIAGMGKIANPVTFNALTALAAPTGMTGITKPFQLDITNKMTTSALA